MQLSIGYDIIDTWKKIDMRKLNAAELYMKRKEVVRLRKTNHTGKETAEIAEISESQVSWILKTYQSGGIKGQSLFHPS